MGGEGQSEKSITGAEEVRERRTIKVRRNGGLG